MKSVNCCEKKNFYKSVFFFFLSYNVLVFLISFAIVLFSLYGCLVFGNLYIK